MEQIEESTQYIMSRTDVRPQVGIILGSGLADAAGDVEDQLSIPYADIPDFPIPMVPGHPGNLCLGRWADRDVAVMQGRFHHYEGYTVRGTTFPVRVMAAMGVTTLIVTNGAGGLNPRFEVGDFMVIVDHLNFMGDNPLIGPHDDLLGPLFVDMSRAYDADLSAVAGRCGSELGLSMREGVYAAVSGPTYETPAETAFLRKSGADAVGMSTAPEVIVAVHAGLKVVGISAIVNICYRRGTPSHGAEASHEKVIELAGGMAKDLGRLLACVIRAT